jgi:phosphodiesterase/alkaline phosphatase D-like protein
MSSNPSIRFSQFNASLNRNREGELVGDLSTPNNSQAKAVAEIIQRNQPDVLLINEFDYVNADPLQAVRLFQQNYLSIAQNGATPIEYPYIYIAPSNTGIASGFDLDNDGRVVTAPGEAGYGNDALGFGNFPGQFGMLLLSKYPIDTANIRTFQNFLWKDMPGSLLPTIQAPNSSEPWYSPEEQGALRLSSKSHWDVPILVNGEVIHVLVSHPTPPVFDGEEDRNGKRNHDEIRFWADYVSSNQGGYIYDAAGRKGGLAPGSKFVIMGDQNADPNDGDSFDSAISQLLQNPNINTNFIPTSPGGSQQAELQGGANANHKSNPAFDTADFSDTTPGNLRSDYVLPSNNLRVENAQVFWPLNTDPSFPLVGTFDSTLPGGFPSSDHRLVWADVQNASPSQSLTNLTFQGQNTFETSFIPSDRAGTVDGKPTELGGLSGVTYDAKRNRFYAIADDRSERAPARFYTFELDLGSGSLNQNGVTFTNVTPIKDANNSFYAALSLDPEGIALTQKDSVFISSEGEVNPTAGRVTNPFVNEYDVATGQLLRSLSVPKKFLPVVQDTNRNGRVDADDTQTSGIRNNLAFESLTISPDQRFLYTASENALFQDGDRATLQSGSRSRILQYNTITGQPEKEYLYITDPVAQPPNPTTGASDNGLVDLLAIDDRGTLLALERSFSAGVGNTIKIYEIKLENATDISTIDSLNALNSEKLAAIRPAQKRLLLNLDDLALPTGTDNIEGITFGPKLPDGRQSIVLVSDNNFSQTQFTQILALGSEFEPVLNGIASGDTTQTSTILWAKSNVTGAIQFEYFKDSNYQQKVGAQTATVTSNLQPAKVEVTGLDPNTTYYYRVTDATGSSQAGRFTTAAEAGTRTGLRFGATGDWRGELAPYPALSNAADRDLNFFIELGDTIYADFPSPALRKPQAETLDEFRLKHAEVYGQRFGLNTWGDLRSATSILATIDDHEVINDFEGGALASSDPRLKDATTGRLVNDTQLYDNGLQAFQEYNPVRDDLYGETGDPRTAGERKLYRFNTYGSDAATFVLDARSFRDEGLAPVTNLNDPTQVSQFLAQSFNPQRTFLGRQQVEDLKRDLLKAETAGVTWKFVVVPEPIQNLGILAASDRFEGYAAERTEILKFITENRINNVVFVAADIHGTVVNNLTYQTAPGQPQITTNAFEITTGSLAFDAPFGPTVAELAAQAGLITAPQKELYDSLPTAGKDTFIKQLVDNGLTQLGYDPVGLNNNLSTANNAINATLLQGDYVATHSYGWTEFDINKDTQKLTVTTYGIPSYTEKELIANPSDITSRTPAIVSQFEVTPTASRGLQVPGSGGIAMPQSNSLLSTELTADPIIRSSTEPFLVDSGRGPLSA